MSYGDEYRKGWEKCQACGLTRAPGELREWLRHGKWVKGCADLAGCVRMRAKKPVVKVEPEVLP